MHSMRSRQVFFEPEPEYWMVMTVTVPVTLKTGKDGRQVEEFAEEDVQDNILLTALHQSYAMFKLFNGRFTDIYSQFSLKILRHKLQEFFPRYLTSLRTEHFDLLTACNGIQFMPLDKNTYLRVQCFVNLTETTFPQIKHTVFLHNEHLIWSGLEQDDMRTLYRLLTSGFLSATLTGSSEPGSRTTKGGKASATGGSGSGTNISLFQQQQQAALREMQPFLLSNRVGYITGPEDLSDPDTPVNAPQLFVESAQDGESLHLIIYQSNNAIVCFLVDASVHFDIKFYRDLDSYIAPQVRGLSETISEHLAKRSAVESHYRYIYYNHMNLALKSTMHNKRQLTVPPDVLRILSDMRSHFEKSPLTHELVVKMLSDCWVVGRKSEQREIFVMLQQKNANLIEINDEVRRLCMTLFNNIFLE
ncbi:hypothetical protein, variant [Capsaspora owczarzaki ATCC 30864]|nr:hypothetical protein, variant [Capsaspora owczarzaki ATCC 30864]